MVPTLVRFSPMLPALVPVVPVALDVTVQVALGAEPDGVAEAMVGAVPPGPEVTSAKLPVVTLLTGSLNVTVQEIGPALTAAEAPARLIEVMVGAVVS